MQSYVKTLCIQNQSCKEFIKKELIDNGLNREIGEKFLISLNQVGATNSTGDADEEEEDDEEEEENDENGVGDDQDDDD